MNLCPYCHNELRYNMKANSYIQQYNTTTVISTECCKSPIYLRGEYTIKAEKADWLKHGDVDDYGHKIDLPLLTKAEAKSAIYKAGMAISEDKHLRFGQMLYNFIDNKKHQKLLNFYNGTEKDFFHIQDVAKVLKLFYEYYVESE